MFRLIQPGVVVLIGIALVAYGCVHIVNQFPPPTVFQSVWQSLPDVLEIGVFLLGLIAVGIGIASMVMGVRGVRRRLREVRQVFGGHRRLDPEEEDYYGEPAYR